MKLHKTEEVPIKVASIDIAMVPLIKWLNSFQHVSTYYCCEGDASGKRPDRPYVAFCCGDYIELVQILQKIGSAAECHVEFSEVHQWVWYVLRFSSKHALLELTPHLKVVGC